MTRVDRLPESGHSRSATLPRLGSRVRIPLLAPVGFINLTAFYSWFREEGLRPRNQVGTRRYYSSADTISLPPRKAGALCDLYSRTTNQQAIRNLAKAMRDVPGNLPSLPGIFPDQLAPVARTGTGRPREIVRARWGMPSPAFALASRKVDRGVTNVRNTGRPHWRRWLPPASGCLVPFTSFGESSRRPDGKPEPVWFALDENRPLRFSPASARSGPAPESWQSDRAEPESWQRPSVGDASDTYQLWRSRHVVGCALNARSPFAEAVAARRFADRSTRRQGGSARQHVASCLRSTPVAAAAG